MALTKYLCLWFCSWLSFSAPLSWAGECEAISVHLPSSHRVQMIDALRTPAPQKSEPWESRTFSTFFRQTAPFTRSPYSGRSSIIAILNDNVRGRQVQRLLFIRPFISGPALTGTCPVWIRHLHETWMWENQKFNKDIFFLTWANVGQRLAHCCAIFLCSLGDQSRSETVLLTNSIIASYASVRWAFSQAVLAVLCMIDVVQMSKAPSQHHCTVHIANFAHCTLHINVVHGTHLYQLHSHS